MELALGIIVLVMALALSACVLMQSGKDSRMSGVIAGGAETFFGKSKANTMDRVLNKLTIILGVVFAVLVLVMYIVVG